ncbi:centromere protein M isoform X2 [Spea bombifrons]|uniref:centromere protein M isoform X2 n=1 Tax=Spea bombifrons TaxID=233779 RepID=UPI002349D104|nr:centromere protein M isoform X2 [Spea bombifrons]
MTSLRPFDKLPKLNTAVVLLVGSEEIHREKIANAILKEPKTVNVKIHMTQSLPLPYEREHLRPRFDMVVFLINLRSQFSLSVVLRSLSHLDLNYFLGKVCFLATGSTVARRIVWNTKKKTSNLRRNTGCSGKRLCGCFKEHNAMIFEQK